jgi:predicted Zn finger-like uncharacterized protein
MPINVNCPACRAAYLLADTQAGKKVRCKHCQTVFIVAVQGPARQVESPPEIEIIAEPPRPRSAPPAPPPLPGPPPRPRAVQPLPERRPSARRPMRREEDDDDVEAGASGRKTMAIVLLSIGGLVLIGGGIALIFALGGGSDKQVAASNPPPQTFPPPIVFNNPPPQDVPPPPPPTRKTRPPEEEDNPPATRKTRPPEDEDNPPPKTKPEVPPETKKAPFEDPATPRPAEISREATRRVKNATVFVKVTMADGKKGSGTGFFAVPEAPNLVITNAHVVGMISPDSKPPLNLEVRIHSGQPEEQSMGGRVLGVDRSSDLAVIQVDRNSGLPQPLVVQSARGLEELDKLYTSGFPLGESLGKEITIRPTSVSSLRKKNGALHRIQVNGGMDPGNSGGPVVDTRGFVVGVAVAGIEGRQINFAIPGDYVHSVLDGRISELGARLPYIDESGQIIVPITMVMIDPRRQLKEVALDVWTSDKPPDGKGFIPPSNTAPAVQPGESEHLHYKLPYSDGIAKAEVAFPPLAEGKVYWIQPNWVSASGRSRWATGQVWRLPGQPVERKPVTLQTRFTPNTIRPLTLKSTNSFRPAGEDEDEHVLQMRTVASFNEKVASSNAGRTTLMLQYTNVTAEVAIDKKSQVDPDLEKVKPFLPAAITVLQLDGKGQITSNNLDQNALANLFRLRGKDAVEAVTDFHEPIKQALESLSVPLPGREVKPLESWQWPRPLPIPTPGRFSKGQVNLTYTYLGLRTQKGKTLAVIDIQGEVTGKDKKQLGGKAEGFALIDPATGQVVQTQTTVKMEVEFTLPGAKPKPVHLMATLSAHLERGGS